MALVNIALYCSKAEIRVPVEGGVGWWWWGGANRFSCQTHNQVALGCFWVAFGLGCCCLAWLWGYDNSNQHDVLKVVESFSNNNWIHMEVISPLCHSSNNNCDFRITIAMIGGS